MIQTQRIVVSGRAPYCLVEQSYERRQIVAQVARAAGALEGQIPVGDRVKNGVRRVTPDFGATTIYLDNSEAAIFNRERQTWKWNAVNLTRLLPEVNLQKIIEAFNSGE